VGGYPTATAMLNTVSEAQLEQKRKEKKNIGSEMHGSFFREIETMFIKKQ
jgi:hypothetical protein